MAPRVSMRFFTPGEEKRGGARVESKEKRKDIYEYPSVGRLERAFLRNRHVWCRNPVILKTAHARYQS